MIQSTAMLSVCLLAPVIFILPTHSLETEINPNQNSRIRKRSFGSWPGVIPSHSLNPYTANSIYKPQPYTISRPYYIPVYGIQGNYIFYPPQPLYSNPGIPRDNPVTRRPPFQAPTYLPPKENPSIGDRYGGLGMEDDDLPIWGTGDKASMPLSGGQDKEWTVEPTRAPISSVPQSPPLIHSSTQSKDLPLRETQRPSAAALPPQALEGPTNCVWAIISCCSTTSPSTSVPTVGQLSCFDQRGCPGPFWGASPCNSDFAKAAIENAVKYYSSNPNPANTGFGK